MLRRTYEADWERKKNYLIRSLFHETPELSTIRESEELSASPPHHTESAFHVDAGPLPDLIIERVLKRHSEDESELFYYGLRKRMRQYYRMIFNIERDRSSSPDIEDFVLPPSSKKSRYDDDNDHKPDLNSAFVEDFGADSNALNKSNASDNTNETIYLDENQSVASYVNKSRSSEVNTDIELSSAIRKLTEEKGNDGYVEQNKSIARDGTSGDNSKENIDPKINLCQLHSNNPTGLESTMIKSWILPARFPQKKQDSLLEINDQSEKQNGKTKSFYETSEENSPYRQVENKDVEKNIPEKSDALYKTVENETPGKENNEYTMTENLNDANRNQNEESSQSDNSEEEERSSTETNNEISKEKEYEQNNNKTGEEKDIGTKENDTLYDEKDNNKIIFDEIEIMRSHNPSPSTQSLVVTSTSSSPPNIHLERKVEIVSRLSLLSDRESIRLDTATRAMDISETSPEGFHPFCRCSTPISTDPEKRGQNIDRSNSPVLHLNSEQKHENMLTTHIVREYGNKNNTAPTTEQITAKRQDRAVAELILPVQNVSSTMKKTNVARTLETKEFREIAAQTDNRITEQAKIFFDIGVQVQEKEKQVISVQVQTDEDEDSVLFGRQRIFRSGSNYFIFL